MTKPKQQGPAARKFTCGRCGVLRWTEQFAGVSVSKLTPTSLCDLCKMAVKFEERLEQLQTAYLSREAKYEARIAQLEKEVERLRKIFTDSPTPTPAAEVVETGGKTKKNKNRRKRNRKVKKMSSENKEDKTIEVRDKKKIEIVTEEVANKKTKRSKKRNKKGKKKINEDGNGKAGERTETKTKVVVKVFGDSLVRGLGEPLTDSKRKTQVTCLPGRGNLHIRKEVEKSSLTKER